MTKQKQAEALALVHDAELKDRLYVATSDDVSRRLHYLRHSGRVVSPAPRIFASSDLWSELPEEERALLLMHALAERDPDILFSHTSAALTFGLSLSRKTLLPLHATMEPHANVRGTRYLRRHTGALATCTRRDGLRVTTLERTLIDCLLTLDLPDALALADSALRLRLIDKAGLVALANGIPHRQGAHHARQVALLSDPRAECGSASVARAAILQLGYMPPELQRAVRDPLTGIRYQGSFYWHLPEGIDVIGMVNDNGPYVDTPPRGGSGRGAASAGSLLRAPRTSTPDIRVIRLRMADVYKPASLAALLELHRIPKGFEPPQQFFHPKLNYRAAS